MFPIFSPFCLSFLFPFCFLFFPFILLLCFLDFADVLFGFSIFFAFLAFFFKFLKKKIRISYGLVNINVGRIQNWVVNHQKRNVT